MDDREPTNQELEKIEAEYDYGLKLYPIETDENKSIADWSGLVSQYAMMALIAETDDEIHERFIQAAQLCIRAANAVRHGRYSPDRFGNVPDTVEQTEPPRKLSTSRIPYGVFGMHGSWLHNPNLKASREEQIDHNIEGGHLPANFRFTHHYFQGEE
jgi:hypothetical protein